MGWQPPEWARSREQLSDRWLGTCRKFVRHEQFFVALGLDARLCRLFAVACTRAAFGKRLNTRTRALLSLVERQADGQVSDEKVGREVNAIAEESYGAGRSLVHPTAYGIASMIPLYAATLMAKQRRHSELFGKTLVAMIGPGWKWSDDWRTPTAVTLAQEIYDKEAWTTMPILSDALGDAGCDDARLSGYCRGSGPFFRGCWVLDAVLGKRD
jgi:hypothetical protein